MVWNKGLLLIGAASGLVGFVAYLSVMSMFVGLPMHEKIVKPFFFISSPAVWLGQGLFGQAPIPVFIVLGCYWAIIGTIVTCVCTSIAKRWIVRGR